MLPRLPAIELADIGYAWLPDLILWAGAAIALAALAMTLRRIARSETAEDVRLLEWKAHHDDLKEGYGVRGAAHGAGTASGRGNRARPHQ